MKKLIFTLAAIIAVQLSFGQATYYWVGGTAPAAGGWSSGANWNTQLDGSGNTRTAATNDILIFDGTNVGGLTPTTGAVSISLTSQTIGKLVLQNGANLSLSRNGSGGTSTLTIGDDPSGDDLVVFAGCTLKLKGLTGSILLLLANNAGSNNSPPATTSATARIYGDIVLEEGDNTYQNRFTSRLKGAFVFAPGSTCTTNSAYNFYPFGTTGSSTTPALHGVTFESGSSFYYNGGLSPFGSNSTSFQTEFQPGSKFYFRAAPAANMFGGRSYGDVVVENNATVTSNGSLIKIDSLRVEAGATFITNVSGVTPITGNIVVRGTFKVPDANPDRENRVIIAGSGTQTLSGTGTVSLADLIISNASTLSLQKGILVDSVYRVIGTLTTNGNTISGAGTASVKSAASVNVNGNTNVDSFLVKNIADFTNIEVGMSVSGTGIPANTVVTNTSSASGTITLSKAVTGSSTYAGAAVALTIYNGQGVFPVKFGSFSGTLDRNKVNLTWQVYTEDNVAQYIIERSGNGREFASIGNVRAEKLKDYTFTDLTPLAGANYYRIKAVDVDGKFTYTSVIRINTSYTKADLQISPNPVQGKNVRISLNGLNNDNYNLTLLSADGQKVYTQNLGRINGSINTAIALPSTLKAGIYTVIVSGNDQQLSQRLIVQ